MMQDEQLLRAEFRRFVQNELLMGDAAAVPTDDASFLETGVIDSTGALEVVLFLEEHFGLKVDDHEIVPENLDSINHLVGFVKRKQHAA